MQHKEAAVLKPLTRAERSGVSMELNMHFDGLLRIPSAPLVEALQQISK
jgi:hypothetical protein